MELLANPLVAVLGWCLVLMVCGVMGGLWLIYLIKLALNEDEVQEKIHRHKRIAEEMMRAQEL